MSETSFTAAELTAFIAGLQKMLARGVLKSKVAGEEIEFGNVADLKARIAHLQSLLESQTSGRPRSAVSVSYPVTSRGL